MGEGANIPVDGRYALLRLLGEGGMGKVYLARDGVLGRAVALKLLKDEHASSEEFISRFEREAMSAASLSHPHIVSVYDRGGSLEGGIPYYIAMEYLPGGTLKERLLREGPLKPHEASRVASQIALALGAAHDRGVFHRDVKPHNVFLTERGTVKVGDFGIARATQDATGKEASLTQASVILGTVRYLSPEQAKGEEVGPKSDLYSLGVTLYEMLTGSLPFDAQSPLAVAMKHVLEPPPQPKAMSPKVVPDGLNTITLRLLSKDPKDRYEDAYALADELERAGQGLPVQPLPAHEEPTTAMSGAKLSPPSVPPNAERPRRPVGRTRRRRRFLPLIAAALLLATLLLPLSHLFGGNEKGLLDAPPPPNPAQDSAAAQAPVAYTAPTTPQSDRKDATSSAPASRPTPQEEAQAPQQQEEARALQQEEALAPAGNVPAVLMRPRPR